MGFIDRIFGRASNVAAMPISMMPRRRANPLISIPVYSVFGGGMTGAPLPLYMPGEPGWAELCKRMKVPIDSDPWKLAEMTEEDDVPQTTNAPQKTTDLKEN